jgi:histidinol-phosphatase (PHP family)
MSYVDCHLHTFYSGHGVGTVEEVCCAAEDAGLDTIAFTEHLPLPAALDPTGRLSMTEAQEPLYRADICAARIQHPDLRIISGCEADWRPGAAAYLEERLRPYEFCLGSVHMLADGWCFDDPAELAAWSIRGADAIWKGYFELWFDAISSDVGFAAMAHPDLPKKFGILPSFDLEPYYRQAAHLAISHDVRIEVSTAGCRKPVGEYYPSKRFLEVCAEEGVRCTVGSDAHDPREVGFDIVGAYAFLRSCGYRQIDVPTGRDSWEVRAL